MHITKEHRDFILDRCKQAASMNEYSRTIGPHIHLQELTKILDLCVIQQPEVDPPLLRDLRRMANDLIKLRDDFDDFTKGLYNAKDN